VASLLTVGILFAATWVSLLLAKLVTRPVAALAQATREISMGHLGHRVDISATDELGDLVSSFNSMASDLETSRIKIEQSTLALADTNTELEQRRRHIETILENIPPACSLSIRKSAWPTATPPSDGCSAPSGHRDARLEPALHLPR